MTLPQFTKCPQCEGDVEIEVGKGGVSCQNCYAYFSICKRCGKPMEWKQIMTRDGPKSHPYDYGTNTSHFRTCPYAKEFMPSPPKSVRPPRLEKPLGQSLDDFNGMVPP